MKVETQFLENQQAQITAVFEPEELASAKQRAARQLAKRVKIPGFRPGKAPYAVIERTVGDSAIQESAVELLVNDNYSKILDEAAVEPYAPGELKEIVSIDPPTFQFVVPMRPSVTLGDYRSLRRPYERPVTTDDDVARVLRDLQERQAIVEPVERPVQAGDQVMAKLSGQRKVAEEGQDTIIVAERSQTIDISQEGDDTTHEWPYPAFSPNLIGMVVGEEKTLTYTYPDDYDYTGLRDVEAEFHVVIEGVKARTLPELNDELAQTFGDFPTVDDLKARIRENLEAQSQQEYDRSYTDALLDEILALSTVQYPLLMVENEINAMIDETSVNLERRGMDMETYLKARKLDEAALREETRPAAEARIRRSLVLMEITRKEDIKVNQTDIQMQAYQSMHQITQNLKGKDLRRANSQEFVSTLLNNIAADMYTQATLERIRAIARGEIEAQELAAETAPDAPAEPETPAESATE